MSFDDDRDMCSKIAKGMITSLKMNDQELLGQHQFDTGAVRSSDVDHLRYDLISPIGLRRLAERYHKGVVNYPEGNWLKGIPATNLIYHMMAHFEKYRSGDRTEDHLAALAWGAFVLMHYEETMPEMMDVNRYPLRSVNDDGSPRKRS
jgi:hypothetical protein